MDLLYLAPQEMNLLYLVLKPEPEATDHPDKEENVHVFRPVFPFRIGLVRPTREPGTKTAHPVLVSQRFS